MKIRFFDPGASYLKIKPEIDAAIQDVLTRGDLILRCDVEEFEESLAKYVGTKYAIGVNSGTDALSLCLQYFGIGPKDTVLVPSYTFRATPDTALRTGANVKLYDINDIPDFDDITVWMPAYIAGAIPEWLDEKIAEAHGRGIIVIEDACQAIGASHIKGDAACYSFYPAKILGAYGDAGGIATNNEEMALWLKRARNHFKGEEGPIGLNSRLDNLQAAVLNVKMKYLPAAIKRRKEIGDKYSEAFKMPKRDVYQDFIIEVGNVPTFRTYLLDRGIETMENGYPFAYCIKKGPDTVNFESHSVRIPCNENLTDEEVEYIIKTINDYGR